MTRSLLEVFAEQRGLRLGIVTKSTLIERDNDLLVRIAQRNRLTLHVTITTRDAQLARILEPRAPRPDMRFRTVERLRAAGLRIGLLFVSGEERDSAGAKAAWIHSGLMSSCMPFTAPADTRAPARSAGSASMPAA